MLNTVAWTQFWCNSAKDNVLKLKTTAFHTMFPYAARGVRQANRN